MQFFVTYSVAGFPYRQVAGPYTTWDEANSHLRDIAGYEGVTAKLAVVDQGGLEIARDRWQERIQQLEHELDQEEVGPPSKPPSEPVAELYNQLFVAQQARSAIVTLLEVLGGNLLPK